MTDEQTRDQLAEKEWADYQTHLAIGGKRLHMKSLFKLGWDACARHLQAKQDETTVTCKDKLTFTVPVGTRHITFGKNPPPKQDASEFKPIIHDRDCAGIEGANEDYGVPCTCGASEFYEAAEKALAAKNEEIEVTITAAKFMQMSDRIAELEAQLKQSAEVDRLLTEIVDGIEKLKGEK